MSETELISFFRPKSVAIVGASDKNPWAGLVLGGLQAMGFSGPIHLVNARGAEVLGRPTRSSVLDIGEPVDNAFLMVPAVALGGALLDIAAAGIRNAVVVTSGFAELGAEGKAIQDKIFSQARDLDLRVMGPNSLGFANYVDRVSLAAIPVNLPLLPNPRVAVVSQSGATAGLITSTAHSTNVSLAYVVAMGNEALIDMAEVIEFLLDDPSTRAIALFAESVRRPEAFLAAARKALAVRKPIVMLKVGVGELAAKVAQAHTGALVGDNRIVDAICRELGIVRVDTIEQLLQTADLLAHTGVLEEGGFGVASMSGGTCEMIADLGETAGVPFAKLSSESEGKLKAILADYATVQNPLDVTGGVLSNFSSYGEATEIVGSDPAVSLVAACFEVPTSEQRILPLTKPLLGHLADGLNRAKAPGFLLGQSYSLSNDLSRQLMAETGLPHFASGLGSAMNAVAAAFRWSARIREGDNCAPAQDAQCLAARPKGERETLDYLSSRGVPVVPAAVARSAEEAQTLATRLGEPVALKILSPDIQHKTEVGGVALHVADGAAAAREYSAMIERVSSHRPNAQIDGVIVSPMRTGGIELIVGVARDPSWGLVLAVGLGGVWVELLADVDLNLLPVSPAEVEKMLGRLKASRLLDGYRGQPAVDRARVAEVVAAIGEAALALGPDLVSLEINPLWVRGDRVECLDALAIWDF